MTKSTKTTKTKPMTTCFLPRSELQRALKCLDAARARESFRYSLRDYGVRIGPAGIRWAATDGRVACRWYMPQPVNLPDTAKDYVLAAESVAAAVKKYSAAKTYGLTFRCEDDGRVTLGQPGWRETIEVKDSRYPPIDDYSPDVVEEGYSISVTVDTPSLISALEAAKHFAAHPAFQQGSSRKVRPVIYLAVDDRDGLSVECSKNPDGLRFRWAVTGSDSRPITGVIPFDPARMLPIMRAIGKGKTTLRALPAEKTHGADTPAVRRPIVVTADNRRGVEWLIMPMAMPYAAVMERNTSE